MKKNIRKQATAQASLVGLLLIFVLPFAVVVYQLISEIDVGINFAQKEKLGLKYNHPLRKLLENLLEHRYLTTAYLRGDTAFKEQIPLRQSQIEDDIKAIDAVDRQLGVTLKTSEKWIALKKKWQTLKGKALSMPPQDYFDAHTALIEDVLSLIAHVGDTSNLILDPVLDSYYLMDALVTKLPPAIEKTAQARDLGVEMAADKRIDTTEKAQLTILSSLIKSPNDAVRRGIQVAFNTNSNLKPRLQTNAQYKFSATNNFIEIINQEIIINQGKNLQLTDYFARGTKAIDTQFKLYDVMAPTLDELLQKRIDEYSRKKYLVQAFALLVLATVIYVFVAFARSLAKRKQSEEEIRLLQTISHTVSECPDFHSALRLALYKVCEATGWSYGEAWIPQPDKGVLECSPAWYASIPSLEQFRRMGEEIEIPLGTGLPGRVWSSQQPEWIQDVSQQPDTRFLRIQMAKAVGFKAALGIPIIADIHGKTQGYDQQAAVIQEKESPASQVVAVLIFFMSESRKEDKRLVDIVSAVAAQLGSLIQRKRAEVALQESLTRLAEANQEITLLNKRLEAENLRMSAELEVTRRLQQMLLPKEPELQSIDGLEIAGFMEPAQEVGGDYYDVLNHDGRVKIGIGDVTGHGLESGVLMIMVQTAVRTLLANNETDPTKFLSAINRAIYDNVQRMNSDKNLSLSLLDYQEGRLCLSGQHEEMIVVRSGGRVERLDTIDLGFPIGLEADIADFVAQTSVQLNSGDVVVLYTDGITEAENLDGVLYGVDRLCEVVRQNCQQSALEIRLAVIEDVRQHIGKQTIFDDITLLVCKQK